MKLVMLHEMRHPSEFVPIRHRYRPDVLQRNEPVTAALERQGRAVGLQPTTLVKLLDLGGRRAITRVPGYCTQWHEAILQWGTMGKFGPALDSNYGADLCVVNYNQQDQLHPLPDIIGDIVGWAGEPTARLTSKEIATLIRRGRAGQDVPLHGIVRNIKPGVYNSKFEQGEAGFGSEMIINVPCRLVRIASTSTADKNLIYLTTTGPGSRQVTHETGNDT